MKKILAALIVIAVLIPAGSAHAFLGLGSCGAASAVSGAVSQAGSKIANTVGGALAGGGVSKIANSVGGAAAGKIANTIAPGAGAVAGLATGASEVPVKDARIRTNTDTLVAKECIGDALAFSLKEGLISAMTYSIVDWINNGFEGGPSFVTDFNQFLGEIADQTSLDFIYGSELGFICSPFQLDIQLALAAQQQPFRERIRCSLGDVADNASAFFKGDFSQGGWQTWWSIHFNPANNPYGAYAIANAELNARIAARQDAGRWEVTVGGGFFSKKKCVQYAATSATVGGETTASERQCIRYEIVTPGAQINDRLSQVLGSGFRQLELADEINEIINALISQLSYQALSSLDGVRGLSSRSSSSSRNGRSYLEALANETSGTSVKAAQDVLVANIESAIALEEDYRSEAGLLIAALEDTDAAVYACYLQAVSGTPEGTGTAARIAELKQGVEAAEETLDALVRIEDQALRAAAPEALNNAADAYDAVLASGALHSEDETAALQSEREDIALIATSTEDFCPQSAAR